MSQGHCEILCHAAYGLSGGEAPFGLEAKLWPGVRPGAPRPTRLRGAEQARERLVAPSREAAGRAPDVHEADGEVTSGSPRRELPGAVERAEPDADAVGEVKFGPRSLPGARTDRAGRCLPEALPLVVAHRHGPTVPGHVRQRAAHVCQSGHHRVSSRPPRHRRGGLGPCRHLPVGVPRAPTGVRSRPTGASPTRVHGRSGIRRALRRVNWRRPSANWRRQRGGRPCGPRDDGQPACLGALAVVAGTAAARVSPPFGVRRTPSGGTRRAGARG